MNPIEKLSMLMVMACMFMTNDAAIALAINGNT
jgi:hypothetical protein